MADRPEISREEAERLSTDLPTTPDRWKPTLWTFEHGGRRFAVKDVRRTSTFFRFTAGRWTVGHEARIYRRLEGLDFVPPFRGKFDSDAMILEWIDATSLRQLESPDLPPGFFDALQSCVDQLHARGVVHMDMRHRTNILRSAGGAPRLVDFEIAFYLGRWLAPLLGWVDRSAVTKFRIRYSPDEVSEAQVARYARFTRLRKLWPFGRVWPPRWLRPRKDEGPTDIV